VIFVFSDCELDLDRFELRRAGQLRPVEPQVFDLLAVLIRERHRDDGRSQRLIRTAHGRGYQFAAPVDEAAQPDPVASLSPTPPAQEIRLATAGDGIRLAYAISGAGPPLVKAANWLSHLAYDWGKPGMATQASRVVEPLPPGPVRRARLRAVGLGHRSGPRAATRSGRDASLLRGAQQAWPGEPNGTSAWQATLTFGPA